MQAIKVLVATITLAVITGCASAPQQIPFVDTKRGETEVGASARAYVGDTIYRKFDIKEQYEAYVTGHSRRREFSVCSLTVAMVVLLEIQLR